MIHITIYKVKFLDEKVPALLKSPYIEEGKDVIIRSDKYKQVTAGFNHVAKPMVSSLKFVSGSKYKALAGSTRLLRLKVSPYNAVNMDDIKFKVTDINDPTKKVTDFTIDFTPGNANINITMGKTLGTYRIDVYVDASKYTQDEVTKYGGIGGDPSHSILVELYQDALPIDRAVEVIKINKLEKLGYVAESKEFNVLMGTDMVFSELFEIEPNFDNKEKLVNVTMSNTNAIKFLKVNGVSKLHFRLPGTHTVYISSNRYPEVKTVVIFNVLHELPTKDDPIVEEPPVVEEPPDEEIPPVKEPETEPEEPETEPEEPVTEPEEPVTEPEEPVTEPEEPVE